MAPAPRSNPSSSTYMLNMKHTSTNHSVSMGGPSSNGEHRRATLRLAGSAGHFLEHDHQPQNGHDGIHTGESDQREQNVARGQQGGRTVGGAQQSVGDPRLSSDFCREPAGGVGDKRKRSSQQQEPQRPAGVPQPLAPQQ